MRPKLKTFLLSILCLGLIFGSLFIFKKAPSVASYSYYETLKISADSLNGNSVWGGGETFESVISSGGLDGSIAFYSATNKSSGGLEPSGALSIDGIPYQLTWAGAGDYTGNDTIKLYSKHDSTPIVLDTIGAYEKLYILGTASGAGEVDYADLEAIIHYTDGTYDEVNYRLYDWRDAAPVSGVYKWSGLIGRSIIEDYDYEGSTTDAPYLQSATINVDSKKLVSSIDLVLDDESSTSGAYCGIYAITGMVNVSTPSPVESLYAGEVTETTAKVHWENASGATSYRLDVATDANFKHTLASYNNIYTQSTSMDITGLTGNTTYYVRIRSENSEGQSVSSNVIVFTTDPETAPPTISIIANPGLIQIQDDAVIVGNDASGIKSIEESLDGGTTWAIIADSDRTERTIVDNGTYCYRATDNYDNTSEPSCVTYTNLDTAKPVISINTNGYIEDEWTNDAVTLSVESLTTNFGQTKYYYSEDSTNWSLYNGAVIVNEETGNDGKIIYFKAISQAGIESDVQSVIIKRDTTAPSGEITSSNNGWNQFLNTITFGLFFNETKNFDIAASDSLSGVNHIEYLVTNGAFVSKEEALSADGWSTTAGSVAINPDGDFVLYFKLIDNAGNISVINTDGIVLDATEASIRGYVDANHTFALEDGGTYYLVRKILVADNRALDSIQVNGSAVTPQNNIIDLATNQTYVIVATDKASNVTRLTIKTNSLADLDLDLTSENYKTSDYSNIISFRTELSRINETEGSHASTEELQIIANLTESYDELIQLITNLESELDDEANRWANIPDIDHINSSSYDTINNLINDIEATLEEDSQHLAVEDINLLLIQKRDLEDKKHRLGAITSSIDSLDVVNHTDEDTIKTEDKPELEALKTTAKALLAGNNLTEEETVIVETELGQIRALLAIVNEAIAAKDTDSIRAIKSIVPTGYTIDDKDALSTARIDLEAAIEKYNKNYTDIEKDDLNNTLRAIDAALNDIDNRIWTEIRNTTFPTLSITSETEKWIPIDIVGVSATDDYGIDKLEISSDGGHTWKLITTLDSDTVEITKNGTYLFRATNEFGNTDVKSVTYRKIDSVIPVISVDTHGYTSGSWTNRPVTLSAENIADNVSQVALYYRKVSTIDDENDWLPYVNSIIITDDTNADIFEFKAVSATGVESAIERIEVKKDSIVPTGVILTGSNSLNSILNTITFGLLFNETKTYEMTASDEHSGVDSIEYLISESELTDDELMGSSLWQTTEGTVSVDPNKTSIVYYRIKDRAGNLSVVTLSGIVFDLPGLSDTDISINNKENGYSALATGTGSVDLINDLEHTTVDDLNTMNDIRDRLSDYLEKHPSDTSGIVDSLLLDYSQTIETIEEIEGKISTIESAYAGIGSIDYVTSNDKEQIVSLIVAIIEAEESDSDHLTDARHQDLNDKLDALYAKRARIEETQTEIEDIDRGMSAYSVESITKDDLPAIASLKLRITTLIESSNVSGSEKEHLRTLLATITELENRVAEAEKALEEAKEKDQTDGINPDNVTPEDQTSLENAARAYTEALGVFDSNLSLADLFDVNNRITIINSALDILDQVAEFEAMISRLPNPEDVDYNSRLLVKAAEGAYNALSEYGRSLVGPSLLAKYRAVLDSYRAYLEGSPLLYAFETLDVFWWGLSTFAIIAIFILIVRHTHKHYVEASDMDDF